MTSNQVDRINGLVGSIAMKAPCKVATTENITLSGAQTVDGVALTADETPRQRVLVKNQTDTTENGIYDVNSGAWTRSPDFDGARDAVDGTQVLVAEGTVGGDIMYILSATDPVDIGTDSIAFNILVDVIGSAGTAALKDHGTAAGEVPLNSDLGTSSTKDTGTSVGDVVELENVGGSAGLPAVTGEQLTDLDATQVGDGSVSNTEFQYINSLTSNAQTQIDSAGFYTGYAKFSDSKSTGTAGGSAAATTRNVRTLNTNNHNTISGASRSGNNITLPAGTYRILASAPAYNGVGGHRLIWRNTSDSTDDVLGQSHYSPASSVNVAALLQGRFTIAASKTFNLQHYTASAVATDGLGKEVNQAGAGGEVYAVVEIWEER